MKARMTIATGLLAASGLLLSACGTGDDQPAPGATTTAPPASTPAPTASDDPAIESAEDLVGEWSDPAAEWTVTFSADGTFSEDFQGNEGFRTGTYEVEDGIVSLVGGDGNTDNGEIDGEGIVFRLGTLTRS